MSEEQAQYGFPKPARYRDDEYLDWIRMKPCCACGAGAPSDPHHVAVDGQAMGSKPSDLYVIPLCRICHTKLEAGERILTREEQYRVICRLMGEWIRRFKG